MTGTRPRKSEDEITREFYKSIKRTGELEDTLQTYDGTEESDSNSARLRGLVFGHQRSMGLPVPDSVDDLPLEDARRYATAQDGMLNSLYQIAHNRAKDGLDVILSGSDDEKLEGLLGNEEAAKQIMSHADNKGHKEWLEHYQGYQQALDLHDKAKTGRLSKEDYDKLLMSKAVETGKEAKKRAKEMGLDEAKQEFYAGQAAQSVFSRSNPKDYVKSAEAELKEKKNELRKYETDSGKNVKTYVGSAFRKMLDEPAQVSRKVLSYLEAVKK